MRTAVTRLLELGPFPSENDDRLPLEESMALLEEYANLLGSLEWPATDEEAMSLLDVFNPNEEDSCFGLAWTLLHLIETAPSWPGAPATTEIGRAFEARLQGNDEPWMQFLWERIQNGRRWREQGA